jgi:DNA modification methylase
MPPKIHCLYDALVDPSKLKYHPKNRNKHSKEQIERLAKIIEYQGWRYAIKVSKNSNFVTSGHGRIAAAFLKKWKEVPVVYQDYESDEQEYADVQADNAIASWSELDLSGINLDIADLGPDFDLDMLGLKDFTLDVADKFADKDADEVPEVKESICKLGDLWQLGRHRLLCGDATKKEDVERLMNGEKADMVYTDPPYGINLETDYSKISRGENQKIYNPSKNKGRSYKKIFGDSNDFDPTFLLSLTCDELFIWGGNNFSTKLPKGGWICWDKKLNEASDKALSGDFELCWSRDTHKFSTVRIYWNGAFGSQPDCKGWVHPSQKPIALAEWFFGRWGKDKTNIVDLYLGSGSTLIACEKTNRKCFGMEIDPGYCDVIIARWEKFTGEKAVKLG